MLKELLLLMSFVSLLSFSSLFASAAMVEVDKDRVLTIDGHRTFLLGLYETPKDDAVLKQVADAGFNLVYTGADLAALDRVHKFGLHGWLNTGFAIDFSQDKAAREEKLRKMVDTFSNHPALLTWEVPDEALWNCWKEAVDWREGLEVAQQKEKIAALTDKAMADDLNAKRAEASRLFKLGEFAESEKLADEIWQKLGIPSPQPNLDVSKMPQRAAEMAGGMRDGYALLKQLDPHHPVWMNHAPRNQMNDLTAFGKAADAAGCDIYPVPEFETGHSDLPNRSLSSVGAYTDRMQQSIPGKPVWMVLQGFGWADLDPKATEETRKLKPRPTYAESRFMAYDAIVHGSRGILYWGTAYIQKDSPLWKDLLTLVRELADLQPVLSAPPASRAVVGVGPTWGSAENGVLASAKNVSGKIYLLVVNETFYPVEYTVRSSDLGPLNGTTYVEKTEGREAKVVGGALSFTIPAQGVQVLQPK